MSGSADAAIGSFVGEGIDGDVHLGGGLAAHALDDPPDARAELARVEPPGRPGDVAHQPRRELELVEDPQYGQQHPQVDRDGLLQGKDPVGPLLDLVVLHRDHRVLAVDGVDHREVAVEDRLGGPGDLLADTRRELHHVGLGLFELFVEALALGQRFWLLRAFGPPLCPVTVAFKGQGWTTR